MRRSVGGSRTPKGKFSFCKQKMNRVFIPTKFPAFNEFEKQMKPGEKQNIVV